MPRWIPVGLGAFCVVLMLAAIVQSSRIGALTHEVEQLKAKVKGIERNRMAQSSADVPTRTEVQALEKKIARVEKRAAEGAEALLNPPPGAGLPTLI